MLIKLAPMIREKPAAIEKNAVAEGMSRMRGRGLEAHYSISRTSQGERNSPLQGWLDLLKDYICLFLHFDVSANHIGIKFRFIYTTFFC